MMLIKITRESLKFIGSRSIQVNLVPRALSYPPAARILKYPQRLTNHLKKLSAEKDDECKIYGQWYFSHTEDSGEADSQFACGKTGIRYLCYITNKITKKSTFVGTSCVEFFDEEIKKVLQMVLNLISVGIIGQYKGEGSRGKKRFEIPQTRIL